MHQRPADTLAFFKRQGIALKGISGDHPQTVAAISRQVGVPGADALVDARELPSGKAALAAFMDTHSVARTNELGFWYA